MLQIIDKALKDPDTDIYQYGEFSKMAPKILDLIEEAGMLPPLRRGEPDSLFNLTQEFIDEHDIKVNEWEPEDE